MKTDFTHPSLRLDTAGETPVVQFIPPVLREEDMRGICGPVVGLLDGSPGHQLHLDLGYVEVPTAGGLGRLVALSKSVRAAGGELVLCKVGGHLSKALEVTGLARLLHVRPGEGWPT